MKGSIQCRFLTISEVTTILGQSIATTNRRLKEGAIPHIKLGSRTLIPAEFIENLINSAFSSTNEAGR